MFSKDRENVVHMGWRLAECKQYMWQSQAETEHYSVAYFDCITTFEALWCRTSAKGGAHMCWVNMVNIHEFTQRI